MKRAQIAYLDGTFGAKRILEPRIAAAVSARHIDGLYVTLRPGNNPDNPTRTDIDNIAAAHLRPGIVVDNGDFGLDGDRLAEVACDWLDANGFTGSHARDICDVVLVNETQDSLDIISMIHAFRVTRGRYLRTLIWGLQSMQAGWFSATLIQLINNDVDLTLCPYNYQNEMQPVSSDAVKMNLMRREITDARAKVYYGTFYKDSNGNNIVLPDAQSMDGILYHLDQVA